MSSPDTAPVPMIGVTVAAFVPSYSLFAAVILLPVIGLAVMSALTGGTVAPSV